MQVSDRISLNALRVFLTAAQTASIKLAAARLGVTPGAVSRQIQGLEEALGVQLFRRTSNSIQLSEAGELLLTQALPGLHILERASETVIRSANEISVQAPTTMAVRWLIPMLDRFRFRHPDARIRVETLGGTGLPSEPRADIVLAYYPLATLPPGSEVFLEDRCRPYLSPNLLLQLKDPEDLEAIPALQCAEGNWDWQLWLKESGRSEIKLNYAGHFDLDDAALRAAVGGLGMVLSAEFIIRDDLAAGRLRPLPHAPEVVLGCYTIHHEGPQAGFAEKFARWLKDAR